MLFTHLVQVKATITHRRVSAIIIFVFVALIVSVTPTFLTNSLGLKFVPERNKTVVGVLQRHDRDGTEKVSYIVNNIFIPFSSFLAVISGTVVLVINLQKSNTWRQLSVPTSQGCNVCTRNLKVAKMVVVMSTLFIACFTPLSVFFILMTVESSMFYAQGQNKNLYTSLGGFGLMLESVSSSMNILIYYHMSTKYRTTFRQLFSVPVSFVHRN